MNKTWKKLLTWILTLALLAGNVEYVQAAVSHSQADALAWAQSQIGQSLDYDHVYGAQCVDLIAYYYQYLGTTTPGGNAINYASNQLPNGWKRVYSDYQAGDIAVWYADHSCSTCYTSSYGHIGIITSIGNTKFSVIDQNGPKNKGYCAANEYNLVAIQCAIRPDFDSYGGSTGGSTAGYTITDTGVTEITQTSARINFTISPTATVNEVGFYYGTAPDNMTKVVENYSGHLVTDTYQLGTGKWTGALTPGTTYYYKMYMVLSNGTVCESSVGYFTTDIKSDFPLEDGALYKIYSGLSGKILTVPDGKLEDSVRIVQWDDVNADYQLWKAVKQEDGYSFINAYTDKALDLEGGISDDGVSVIQHTYFGSSNQRFKIVLRENDRYSIHPVVSNKVMDVDGWSTENGGEIKQYGYHGGLSQLWYFKKAGDTEAPLITNVKVTDLDRTGYTVQCDVTDDIGVTKVAFPTWTEANGQDDLPDTWSELCAVHEPSSGNTYVYRVNIADHNNETGLYTTHIYAYDAAGNVSADGITAVVTPLKITEFSTVDKKTSYNFGTDIVFRVSADGGSGNYQYQFAYVYGEDPERIISDYSEAASVSWKPDKPGKYMVVARVKDSQGEVSSEPVEINVLCQPHNYNKSVTPPSCTEQGYTTYTCTRCNDSYVSDYTNALGHTWGEQEILKEATLEQAGTVRYTCTVCGASYTEEVLIQFRVLPVPAQKYTGKAVKPTLTVYDGTVRLVSGRDYTVSYTDNIKAGTASAVIYGKGNYQGSKTVNFTILPQSLNDPSVTVSPICAVESGRVQKPMPTVKWNGKALRANLDYTVTYPSTDAGAYQKAGEYVIHVEAKNGSDFSGGFDVPYSIVSKDKIMMSRLTVKTASAMYTGAPVKPVVTVKKGNALLREGTDYQILGYSNNTEIGTAYVTIQGMGNYGGIRMVPFKITGISMSKVKVEGITDQVYDGTPKKQSDLFVTYQKNKNSSRIELVEGKDYTVVYSNNMNAGTASVTLKGKGGYSGSITKKFKIKRADAKDTILLGDNFQDIVKYEKGGARPIPEFYFGNVKLKYGTDYSLSYTNNKSVTVNSAKAATVKAKFKGKFTGSVTLKFFIDTGTFDDALMDVDNKIVSSKPGGWKQSKVSIYDGNGKKLSAGTDYNKKLIYSLDKDGEQILTGSETLPVGTSVYVTAYGIKNYEGAKLTGVYNIVDESINNANIIIKEKNYTGKAVTLEKNDLSVRVGSKELVYGVDYVITQYSKNVKKGTAKVTIKGIGKYCGEKKASFVIAAKKF